MKFYINSAVTLLDTQGTRVTWVPTLNFQAKLKPAAGPRKYFITIT